MSEKTRLQRIEELLADDPDDPFLRYGLAMEHASLGDSARAVACFRELMARSPDYVPAYVQAGQALARLGQAEQAREVFRQGIAAARKANDAHAAGEMEAFLDSLD